jgi:hypothetical protein
MEGLLSGVRRRHVVLEEGVAHIVLNQVPQAASTARKRKVHDIANKFVDGRHGTSSGWRLLLPSSPANSPANCSWPSASQLLER